ncbi:pyridoxal-dependent decarboxylase [Sinirhodobacter sp. WL0062]|uniref:Pyridoxal-dependent decarboxylase n=1 Tax=Rhodobacter flavimaris TaxID=2907145 RepID=A0ABS8YZ36_9RHOB|nr:pyridoxal-dependent decarboxylase [Sinirhodobacter sp. WL0062]MCE5974938.1 pyridoxal-dependent decarboxylase [Sinirhodobacter sp. WL0062]
MTDGHRSRALFNSIERFRKYNPDQLSLDRFTPVGSPLAWFVGPKGENENALRTLIGQAITSNIEARRDFQPDDPQMAPPEAFSHDQESHYTRGLALIEERLGEMLAHMRGSIPLSSYRNQSHMYWDTTLPAVVGHFAGLLYNQNNVATEASPVTTLLEMAVTDDICRMLGFRDPEEQSELPRPWGHITCDGSVANGESLWAARNLKYLPLTLATAIRHDARLASARSLTVQTLDGKRRRLLDLSTWELLNIPVDEAIGLSARMTSAAGIDPDAIAKAIAGRTVQDLGLIDFYRQYLPDCPSPVILAPATAHYSWPKGAALVGLGRSSVIPVAVDLDGRMDTIDLRRHLDRCLDEKRPVLEVIAVIGTTEESAVDPLAEIADIRDEYRQIGLEFTLHADAAWGGYFASMLRPSKLAEHIEDNDLRGSDEEARLYAKYVGIFETPDGENDDPEASDPNFAHDVGLGPGMQLNDYVTRQYNALPLCDTVTVDPHKAGFVPYAAGTLSYRNGAMRDVIAFAAPVVFHGGTVPSVGVYGIEGSKPGAAAAAVYLSHAVIPTDCTGYGRLLAKCMFNSKRFYAALLAGFTPDDEITVTSFQRLPSEKSGGTEAEIAAERAIIAQQIVPVADDALVEKLIADPELRALFRQLGSDQTIIAYTLNFKTAQGLNRDPILLNAFNDALFQKLSVQKFGGDHVPQAPLFVTASEFDPAIYGQAFVDHYATRIGVTPKPGAAIKFLISTQQNPFMTSTAEGDMTPRLIKELRHTALSVAADIRRKYGLTAP